MFPADYYNSLQGVNDSNYYPHSNSEGVAGPYSNQQQASNVRPYAQVLILSLKI